MILSCLIALATLAAASIDTTVSSAIESLVSARTTAVHEIEYHSVPRALARLDAGATFRVIEEPRSSYRGMLSLEVEVQKPDGLRDKMFVGLCVRTFEPVAVASRMLDRHAKVSVEDIVMQQCETTQLKGEPVTASTAVAGMRTRQIIGEGKVVMQSMLEPLPVITSGSEVTVRVKEDNVTIKVAGRARSDGWTGGIITVDLLGVQKQKLRARVIDPATVEVVQ